MRIKLFSRNNFQVRVKFLHFYTVWVNNIYDTHQAKVERSKSHFGPGHDIGILSFISFFITKNILLMGAHLRCIEKVRQNSGH